jgi:hypothetical protein
MFIQITSLEQLRRKGCENLVELVQRKFQKEQKILRFFLQFHFFSVFLYSPLENDGPISFFEMDLNNEKISRRELLASTDLISYQKPSFSLEPMTIDFERVCLDYCISNNVIVWITHTKLMYCKKSLETEGQTLIKHYPFNLKKERLRNVFLDPGGSLALVSVDNDTIYYVDFLTNEEKSKIVLIKNWKVWIVWFYICLCYNRYIPDQ